MIKTRGVHHIGIPVDDMERAVKFYTEILGMSVFKRGTDDMGETLARAELRSGNDSVVLFQRPRPLERNAIKEDGATHQAFAVNDEDFELAAEKMGEWGVKMFTTPTISRQSGRGFYFFDTEGNLLQLYAPPKQPRVS
jgi:catechol 2,3-dioxygenase-like lactoylglutathione lyase family enzyme